MDKNQLTLVGHVGEKMKYDKGTNGKEYVYFPLLINAKTTAKEYDRNHYQIIHVMCFRQAVIDYGFISSYPSEIRGKQIIENGVLANEIYVVKTKA